MISFWIFLGDIVLYIIGSFLEWFVYHMHGGSSQE